MQLRSRLLIAIDDTDCPEQGGTGRVARTMAERLAREWPVWGVTRHQLAILPGIPYTRKNSANVIHLLARPDSLEAVAQQALAWLDELSCAASEPGLCVAAPEALAEVNLGREAQVRVVGRDEVRAAASAAGVILLHPRAQDDGIVGAFAGACLAAGGDDGRFVQVGQTRDLQGTVSLADILDAGVDAVLSPEGTALTEGLIRADRLRPALRGGRCVLYCLREQDDAWVPIVGGPGDKEAEEGAHGSDQDD